MSIYPLVRVHVVHNNDLDTDISGDLSVDDHSIYLSDYITEKFGGLHPDNPVYTTNTQNREIISTEKFEERDDNMAIVDEVFESIREFFPDMNLNREKNTAPERIGTTNLDSQELNYEILILIDGQ